MVTGRKLLLADDSATIQKVVDLTFTDEGMEVISVSDGQQAIEKLEEIVPDIVLADVFMPALSGYQVCEHIKRTERFRHIPVMLLVGSFEPFDEAEARRVGADDYLTKPFQSIRTLIGKVRGLLSGGGGTDEATTRQLAPPPIAEKENRPDAEFLERSTADTAPLPAHEREAFEKSSGAPKVSFADLSLDDEMIETTPADDYDGSGQTGQDEAASPTALSPTADLMQAATTQDLEIPDAPEPRETASPYAAAQIGEPLPATAVVHSQSSIRASSIAAADDALLDLGDLEPPREIAEADDFFLDLLDEAPEQVLAGAPSYVGTSEPRVGARVEQVDAVGRADYESATADADRQSVSSAQEEFPMASHLPATERLPVDFQSESVRTPPRAGQITLEQMSPEVIDAIARRAVEQLSARVVEQIAWEVVPDLAELLIKRRLDEEEKRRTQ